MLGLNKYQFWCLAWITFGSTFYGYDSGITTSVLGYAEFIKYFNLNIDTIGGFNAAYYGASAIGTLSNWYLPNKFGRLRTIQYASTFNILAVALQAGAISFPMFVVGRILGGLAVGLIFSLCPTYAAEISPPHIRGRVGMVYAINVAIGYMITEWLGLAFYFIPGNTAWRVLFGLQLVPTFIMLAGSFFMPFSPRWLVLKGRYDEALVVLRKLHQGYHHDENFYEVEFHQIKAQIELDRQERVGIGKILATRSYRKRLILTVAFFFFQQCTGIIPLQNYQVFIYQVCGFSPVMTLALVGIWGTIAVLAVIVMSPWFDSIGRRVSIFIGYGIMIPGSLLIVIMWAVFENGGSTNVGLAKGIIAGMFIMLWGYAGVMNTFATVYAAEISPTAVRSGIVACGYATFNVVVIALVYITPRALKAISWKYFLIFVILDVIYIIGFYFFYPETKGKTIEEIGMVFGDKVAETFDEAETDVVRRKSVTSMDLETEQVTMNEKTVAG